MGGEGDECKKGRSYRKVGVKGNVEDTWVERTCRLIPCITFDKSSAYPRFIDIPSTYEYLMRL